MPTQKMDPRAALADLDDAALAAEIDGLSKHVEIAKSRANRETREDVVGRVKRAQEIARGRLRPAQGLAALRDASPGTRGFRDVESLALHYILSSEDFGAKMTEMLERDLPSAADLEPDRQELESLRKRLDNARTEQRIRAVEAEQEAQSAARAVLLAQLEDVD